MIAVLDEYAELAGTVAGDGDEGDVARLGQAQALRERPVRLRLEVERGRVEPGGPALVRVTAHPAPQPGCVVDLGARDEDLRIRGSGAGRRRGRCADASSPLGGRRRADAELLELRADLLLGLDRLADGEAEDRMPRGK